MPTVTMDDLQFDNPPWKVCWQCGWADLQRDDEPQGCEFCGNENVEIFDPATTMCELCGNSPAYVIPFEYKGKISGMHQQCGACLRHYDDDGYAAQAYREQAQQFEDDRRQAGIIRDGEVMR